VVLEQCERFKRSQASADSYLSCFIEQVKFGLKHCFLYLVWILG